ncbi:CotH kinase family protein [Streptomyces millisiae]|uniref:CotH kinase family protein n=1 Tax=Streptomyces millisiae TaxID=3075542 RepID=A0ABU2LVG0_9ACTN|nr:CotH kinase family protein [Streptomyces sp. DSM 44918]MDT0321580.1 CotH kinase family protein [Streptomyces sp. DSM 44918]
MGRRLRHRLPVRLRQHWRPTAALVGALGVTLVFFGDARVTAVVTSASDGEGDQITEDIAGTVDLYDASVAHSIQLEYDEEDFAELMASFEEDGEKEYIEADLTIDGTFIESVGIRLKGNSTLSSLRGAGSGGPEDGEGGGGRLVMCGPGPGAEGADGGGDAELPEGLVEGGAGPGGAGMTTLSADRPEELPWLIKIDEYVEGRAYQGHQEISVRPGSDAEVPLNEALSLSLMAATDQAAERFTFSSFTVNNRPTTTRLLVENPSAGYAATLGDDGVLYKARAGSEFSYRGDDPTEYQDDFKQLNMEGSQDLQPVIDLIRWVEEASDAEFAAELDEHVDVESFARYVATQDLLGNFDDMSGPGNNYLLRYDLESRTFEVLGWDFNLTFSGMGMGMAGPGGELGGAGQAPEGGGPAEGTVPPEGMEPPEGAEDCRIEGGDQPPGGDGAAEDDVRGGLMGGNALKERFLESDAFAEVYAEARQDLHDAFYGSGAALDLLDGLVARAEAAGADGGELTTAADTLRESVTRQAEPAVSD